MLSIVTRKKKLPKLSDEDYETIRNTPSYLQDIAIKRIYANYGYDYDSNYKKVEKEQKEKGVEQGSLF